MKVIRESSRSYIRDLYTDPFMLKHFIKERKEKMRQKAIIYGLYNEFVSEGRKRDMGMEEDLDLALFDDTRTLESLENRLKCSIANETG